MRRDRDEVWVNEVYRRWERRRNAPFRELDKALSDLGRELLAIPPGSWVVRFVWWLNGKLGGPSAPARSVSHRTRD